MFRSTVRFPIWWYGIEIPPTWQNEPSLATEQTILNEHTPPTPFEQREIETYILYERNMCK